MTSPNRFQLLLGRAILFGSIAAQLAWGQATPSPKPEERARIEGRIVHALSGEPLGKVNLRLRKSPATGPDSIVTSTNSEGVFVFEDIEAGRYILTAERPGFVPGIYRQGATSILSLVPGQQVRGVEFALNPQASIAGRIIDEDGDPVGRVQAELFRIAFLRGRRQLQPAGASPVLADGSFVVPGLGPGRYYLCAREVSRMSGATSEYPANRGPEEGFVTTFYPRATNIAGAVPFDLAAGAELRGVEIRMRKARLYRIKGKAVGPGPVERITLSLVASENSLLTFADRRATVTAADGAFEFAGLQSRSYVIEALPAQRPGSEESARMLGRITITIGTRDIDNAVIALGPGGELTGRVALEHQPFDSSHKPPRLLVSLKTEGLNISAPGARIAEDGSFRLRGVLPGLYQLMIEGLPVESYLKSAKLNGQDVTHSLLDLSAGAAGVLELTISEHAAECAGVLRDADGKPIPNRMVSLWSKSEDFPRDVGFYRSVNTDTKGAFQFRGLAPGDYRLLAWEFADPDIVMNAEYRARFENKAVSISLSEGSRETVTAPTIPREAAAGEAEKLRYSAQ